MFPGCSQKFVCGFVRGIVFYQDGRIGNFEQAKSRLRSDPTHMNGHPVIIGPERVGTFISSRSQIFDDLTPIERWEAMYNGHCGDYQGYKGLEKAMDSDIGISSGSKNAAYALPQYFLPSTTENVRDGETASLLRSAEFLESYSNRMRELGGISVSVRASVDDAQVVAENSDHFGQEDDTTSWGAAAP
jgi:hypothetical protein